MEIPIDIYRNQVASYMTLEDLFKQRLLGNIAEDIFIEEFLKRIPIQKPNMKDEIITFIQKYGNHPYIVELIGIIDNANVIDYRRWKHFIDFIASFNVLQRNNIKTPTWLGVPRFRKSFRRFLITYGDNLFYFLTRSPEYIPYFVNELTEVNPFIELGNHIENIESDTNSKRIYTLMDNMIKHGIPISEEDLIDYFSYMVTNTVDIPDIKREILSVIERYDMNDIINILVHYDLIDDNRIKIINNVLGV